MNQKSSRLRILHVASGDLWAGAEVQIFQLASALSAFDEVEIAAIVFNEGELARRLREIGIQTRVLDETQLSARALIRETVAFARRWRPDVIHTHRRKENIVGSIAAMVCRSALCVRTVHGCSEYSPRKWQLAKLAARAADSLAVQVVQRNIVAVSSELASSLKSIYPAANIAAICNGIDVEAVALAATPPITLPPAHTHVAFVGRLVPVKRVDVFLRAAASLSRLPDRSYQFHIVGDGPLISELKALNSELGLDARCHFHGFRLDALRWIAAMDCVVFTSEHEGLPMTALEALALGTPVVGHAVGGLKDLLVASGHSVLFDELTAGAVADAIRRAPPLQSRQPCLPDRFTAKVMARNYIDLYRSCSR